MTSYIFCTVRVANVAFCKHVNLRYTTDGWRTQHDAPAAWVSGSLEGDTERFVATINLPNHRLIKNVAFCIQYQANGGEFWDSNNGENYTITGDRSGKVSPPLRRNRLAYALGEQLKNGIYL